MVLQPSSCQVLPAWQAQEAKGEGGGEGNKGKGKRVPAMLRADVFAFLTNPITSTVNT